MKNFILIIIVSILFFSVKTEAQFEKVIVGQSLWKLNLTLDTFSAIKGDTTILNLKSWCESSSDGFLPVLSRMETFLKKLYVTLKEEKENS